MKNKHFIFIFLLCWLLGQLPSLHGGREVTTAVTHVPGTVKTLGAGWEWALKTGAGAGQGKGFYIGYTIPRPPGEHRCEHRDSLHPANKKTLHEILYGKPAQKNDIALLFRFRDRPAGRYGFEEIKINHLDRPVETGDLPVYWLGEAGKDQSVEFLKRCFKNIKIAADGLREEIVMAMGLHGPHPVVFAFLSEVLKGSYPVKVRKSAVFWMAQQQAPGALKELLHTLRRDPSQDVRAHAVFAIGLVQCKEADDALIQLATKEKNKRLRKQAIFWLGQKAVKKSGEILEGLIREEKDSEIQSTAVFALSQRAGSAPKLVKIAKTHPHLAVRKKAIFWLSQSDDPIALKTILEILEK